MRIVLDLQGAQNDSRFRGIGRYSLSLARAMITAGADRHEFHLLLNRNLPEGMTDVAAAFADLPRARLHVLELPHPSHEVDPANLWRNRAAALVREAALHHLQPDIVHVSSLVEGFGDHSVTSIGALGETIPTAITLYDLIPLLRPDTYLADPLVRRWYYRKAQFARRADLLLAISSASALEAETAFGLPDGRVVTIGTGVDDRFRPVALDPAEATRLRHQYRLRRPFVMYAGAADPRKNLAGLMRGYALLPARCRAAHCLAIAGRLDRCDLERLATARAQAGLSEDEVMFLGFVPDHDLVRLYGLCAVLAFPSFHEGFGLPAAEAMACGAAVIGSNATSIPEVIGRADALFDPADPASIATVLARVLTDDDFRAALRRHGPLQAARFTWPDVAARALDAFERAHAARRTAVAAVPRLPRVAFVSPLPPARDGRARHAARLLPELSMVLDLTCITEAPATEDAVLDATIAIRPQAWLDGQRPGFDHVIVSLVNGDARSKVAGASCVLLHDASLSAVLPLLPPEEADALLYAGHGWHAVLYAREQGIDAAVLRFDCLLPFLEAAELVITHSPALAQDLRARLAGRGPAIAWVPPTAGLRAMPTRLQARARLGLEADAFVVTSFASGGAGPQRQVLDAWRILAPEHQDHDRLLFACLDAPAGTAAAIAHDIACFGTGAMQVVTDAVEIADLVAATDIVLQAGHPIQGAAVAVLLPDLLRAGVPVLTSAPAAWSGSPTPSVIALPSTLAPDLGPDLGPNRAITTDAPDIAAALSRLRGEAGRGKWAACMHTHAAWLAPGTTTEAVRAALAATSRQPRRVLRSLDRALSELTLPASAADREAAAWAIRANHPPASQPRLFIDISVLAIHDAGSGIQRVCRSITNELLANPPPGHRVEPIRWIDGDYVFAHHAVRRMTGLPPSSLPELPVRAMAGDIYVCVDLIMETIAEARHWLEAQRLRGMRTVFVLYDLLPFQRPAMFPVMVGPVYRDWIRTVMEVADGVIGISRSVMQELAGWLAEHPPLRRDRLGLGWFHLGGDMDASLPAPDLKETMQHDTSPLRLRPSFLSVGTLEPRKGYRQALDAFDCLWASGIDANYVIVGGLGWIDQAFLDRLEQHPERGARLFWFRGISDQTLALIYRLATALLVVSDAEGFGLPLVEAARFGLPIIARDIAVFREVTAGHASFFATQDADALADHLAHWLRALDDYAVPSSELMPAYTWQASAARLTDVVIGERWSLVWQPEGRLVEAATG